MKTKFPRTYHELRSVLRRTRIQGEWRNLGKRKQFVAYDGAVLNWWRSTKTVTFQGSPASARRNLAAAFQAAVLKLKPSPPPAEEVSPSPSDKALGYQPVKDDGHVARDIDDNEYVRRDVTNRRE